MTENQNSEAHHGHLVDILLVEDSPTDVMMTLEAFKHHNILNKVHVAEDGVEAMDFLNSGTRLPGIIILDLNLPRKNGQEVLAEIKEDAELRKIPVIVLTTSQKEEDIVKSYELAASCYVTKPVDFPKFIDVIKSMQQFWLGVVTLPKVD